MSTTIQAAKKLAQTLTVVEARIDSLTADQMHNAMVNLDRMLPSFGKGWSEFRTFHFVNNGRDHEFDACTKEQLAAYVAHKRDMLAQHSYLIA